MRVKLPFFPKIQKKKPKPAKDELFYAIPLASLIYWISLLLLKEPLALSVLHLLKSLVKKLAES